VAPLIGFAALISGGFSRFGVMRQIILAIFLLVVVKLVESAVTGAVHEDDRLWPLVYLPSLLGAAMAAVLLWKAGRSGRPARRLPTEAEATP
jgi:lipopolysaccharide export system permease protein